MSCWGTQAPWWAAEILHHSWQSIILLPLASASQMGFELVLNRRKPETYPIHKLICLQMFRSCVESRSEAAKLYFYHLSFPFNFGFGCTRSMFLLPVYSFIKSSPLWAQYFCLLHRSCVLFKRSAPLSTLSLSESDYMYLTKKDMEFAFYSSIFIVSRSSSNKSNLYF